MLHVFIEWPSNGAATFCLLRVSCCRCVLQKKVESPKPCESQIPQQTLLVHYVRKRERKSQGTYEISTKCTLHLSRDKYHPFFAFARLDHNTSVQTSLIMCRCTFFAASVESVNRHTLRRCKRAIQTFCCQHDILALSINVRGPQTCSSSQVQAGWQQSLGFVADTITTCDAMTLAAPVKAISAQIQQKRHALDCIVFADTTFLAVSFGLIGFQSKSIQRSEFIAGIVAETMCLAASIESIGAQIQSTFRSVESI